MDDIDLDKFAQHLLGGVRDTADFSREFKFKHEMPPTAMAKVHHLRSVLQARLTVDEDFDLSSRRAEFGRIEFTDLAAGERLLLKSASAFAIEQQMEAAGQLAFFPVPAPTQVADLRVVVFDLRRTELLLSVVSAAEVGWNKKVRVIGQLELAGRWLLDSADFDAASPFEQDARERFDDLGGERDHSIGELR